MTAVMMMGSGTMTDFVTASGTITVSGETISETGGVGTAAGVIFQADGRVFDHRGGVETQIDSGTDWIIPNGDAPSLYEIRATLNSGDTPDIGTIGTWEALTADREWRNTVGASQLETSNLTIAIRFNGGSIIDSATYIITADST